MILIILLLLLTFTAWFIWFNQNAENACICDKENATSSAPSFELPAASNPVPPVHVTPGGNGTGNNTTPPAVFPITQVELFDYNQDDAKTLRVIVTADITADSMENNVSVYYENLNNSDDNGTVSLGSGDINVFDAAADQYLVSIRETGTQLGSMGSLDTYSYSFLFDGVTNTASNAHYPFESGTGTQADPFEITNIVQLDALRYYTEDNGDNASGKYFELTEDINFPAEWNNATNNPFNRGELEVNSKETGWIPIGGNQDGTISTCIQNPFKGTFYSTPVSGQPKTLSDFSIRSGKNAIGLFGSIETGTIKNLDIENIEVSGNSFAGALTSYSKDEKIENIHTSGSIEANYSGGLVGYTDANSFINDSVSNVNVFGYLENGGLVGHSEGTKINNSSSSGNVEGYQWAGGLLGKINNTTVDNSATTSKVNLSMYGTTQYIGGFAGWMNNSNINNSSSAGDIDLSLSATSTSEIGSFAGWVDNSSINNSNAAGNITNINTSVTNNNNIGGFSGWINKSMINNSNSAGSVLGNASIGGLAGRMENSSVNNSNSTGSVYGNNCIGGLVGRMNNSTIENSNSSGKVESFNTAFGGLVGNMTNSTINASYSSSTVMEKDVAAAVTTTGAGGLVGNMTNSCVTNSFANGTSVKGGRYVGGLVGSLDNSTINKSGSSVRSVESAIAINQPSSYMSLVGGLVGFATNKASINNSFATGNVIGNRNNTGGLVGLASGDITNKIKINNSYATGNISGQNDSGGLVGNLTNGSVENCYAAGNITISTGSFSGIGGLIGKVSNSSLDHSIALNKNIEAGTNPVGRVYGIGSGTNTISDHYAYDGMTKNGTGTFTEGGMNGMNVNKPTALTQVFYNDTLKWNFGSTDTVWKMGNTAYPLPVLNWQDESTYPENPPAWAVTS
ncbi:GLUG motif-containing protein [Methanolapillus ohkumae]|uniref:GLUG motif-containing protein n=1 Tax=Methanolapillus ohkumae TaxID=3028298 RepID=UPI0030B9004E